MPVIVPYVRSDAILDTLKGVGGELEGAIVHLFDNDIVPNIDSVIADFTEATFAGYAASTAIVWSTSFRNSLNQAQTVGDTKTFQLSALPGATVYGYYLTVGGALRASERFAAPVPLALVGNAVVLVPTYTLGSG